MVIINDLRVELGMSIILKATQRNIQSSFFVFLQKPFNAIFGFTVFKKTLHAAEWVCLFQS